MIIFIKILKHTFLFGLLKVLFFFIVLINRGISRLERSLGAVIRRLVSGVFLNSNLFGYSIYPRRICALLHLLS